MELWVLRQSEHGSSTSTVDCKEQSPFPVWIGAK